MTLQEAKDQIAKNYGYSDWNDCDYYPSMLDFLHEAAELYARSKWDECYNEVVTAIHANGKVSYVPPQPEFKP